MSLVEDVYRVAGAMSRDDLDLSRQLRRAAVSIPANVAEGWQRQSKAAYRNHIAMALGSQAELDTDLEIAVRVRAIDSAAAPTGEVTTRVGQMLHRLHRSLGVATSQAG